jgi:hypothetical protein
MEHSLTKGGALPELDPADYPVLTANLEREFRTAVPDLWELETLDQEAERLSYDLDYAVIRAYEALRATMTAQGRVPFEEPDTINEPASWLRAIRETRERSEMRRLSTLLLPSSRAEALRAPDYAILSSTDVLELLEEVHVDVQSRPRWLSKDDLRLAFMIWTEPGTVISTPDWRGSMTRLLADMQTARAARYAAIRFRAARAHTL